MGKNKSIALIFVLIKLLRKFALILHVLSVKKEKKWIYAITIN